MVINKFYVLRLIGNVEDLGMSDNGELCCTISDDRSAKIFDVVNFGMYKTCKQKSPYLEILTISSCLYTRIT